MRGRQWLFVGRIFRVIVPGLRSKAIGDADIGDGRLPIIIIVYRST